MPWHKRGPWPWAVLQGRWRELLPCPGLGGEAESARLLATLLAQVEGTGGGPSVPQVSTRCPLSLLQQGLAHRPQVGTSLRAGEGLLPSRALPACGAGSGLAGGRDLGRRSLGFLPREACNGHPAPPHAAPAALLGGAGLPGLCSTWSQRKQGSDLDSDTHSRLLGRGGKGGCGGPAPSLQHR